MTKEFIHIIVLLLIDNIPGRLSVDSDEVILRRTIGHKKDEFFLNRKRIQKSEVISLLESAGFSKSNPYYIVQQGKVLHSLGTYPYTEFSSHVSFAIHTIILTHIYFTGCESMSHERQGPSGAAEGNCRHYRVRRTAGGESKDSGGHDE